MLYTKHFCKLIGMKGRVNYAQQIECETKLI